MMNFFVENNTNNEMMIDLLADSESCEISKDTIRDALEDGLGRKIYPAELATIMEELRKDDFFTDKLKRTKQSEEGEA